MGILLGWTGDSAILLMAGLRSVAVLRQWRWEHSFVLSVFPVSFCSICLLISRWVCLAPRTMGSA